MDDENDIAIVGLACRFPGAQDAREFWRNLAGGIESITQLSDEEILCSGVPPSHLASPNYVKAAPVLEEPGGFDAAFFGFTPNEARTMDPQHRILLELASIALEDAGCDPSQYPGRIGVFAGAAMNTYFMHAGLNRNFAEDYIPTLIFNDKDFLSTRISYKLNLKGPSITVQTACSTSLVAVHLARQSLLSEESDMALAGAVSVRAPHRAGYFADAGGVSSPDGRVRAFDAGANGTVFGSGGGVVVLKRLRDAISDGDTIRAIIKGSAINNDGGEKAGYTAPSVNSQADAVIEALANADASAESISYIEAHGSGTPVGDPIEIRALTKAFRASTSRAGFCAIGSVKTNVGHLDAAAGMAGLIKVVLALEQRQIPPSLNYSQPNPEIDLPTTPFFVNTQLAPWTSASGPRRAGIMSTGMGGTNAHLVLEESPLPATVLESTHPSLLLLSARTETALAASAENLRDFLEADPSISLGNTAYTLQNGRRAMSHRRFVVASDRAGAIAALTAKPARLSTACLDNAAQSRLVLLLPGVGDHYVGMGHELYADFPPFCREVDRCAEILRPRLGVDIREVLYPADRDWRKPSGNTGIDLKKMLAGNAPSPEDADTRRLNESAHLQPALFTIEYALAKLWMHFGVVPQAIIGHSMGEYVAACLAGVFSLEDALRLIVRRTQLVDKLPPARMLAVALSEIELQPLLSKDLSISLINGPKLCVIAGPLPAIQEFEQTLTARGVIHRPVQNTHAFHSRMLDPVCREFEAEVRKLKLNEPRVPFTSNITGRWITKSEATDPAYWSRHLNHTARFNDALHSLWQMENPLLLEVGPGKTLGVLAMQHPDRPAAENPAPISSLRHHYENVPDHAHLLNSVGRLWLAGVNIDWDELRDDQPHRKIPLPTYPFERQNYWLEPERISTKTEIPLAGQPSVQTGIDDWFYAPSWKRTVSQTRSDIVAAGALWVVMAELPEHATAFQKSLASKGAATQFVRLGKQFERRFDDSFEIDRPSPENYVRLFREIKTKSYDAIHIIHLGCAAESLPCFSTAGVEERSLRRESTGEHRRCENKPAQGNALGWHGTKSSPEGAKQHAQSSFVLNCATGLKAHIDTPGCGESIDQNLGLFSLLYIAQAIGELNISIPIKIGVISSQLHDVTGDEQLNAEVATLLGACGVIPKEFPNVNCFNVDLPGPLSSDSQFVGEVLSEFAAPCHNQVIAYRGKHRWRRAYEHLALPSSRSGQRSGEGLVSNRLRSRGVYLITGGTGGVGLTIARHLAETCQARLVLTKRTPFPAKAEWKRLLTDKDTPASAVKIFKGLLEIEGLGADVEVVVADIADEAQMRLVLENLLDKHKCLNGVIHAAGVVRAGLIQTATEERCSEVLRPKVQGTLVLHKLLETVDLDFLVLFSSMASIIGPFAHAEYSAANAFLDAFAPYSNSQRKYYTVSVNWPVWKEVGAVANLEAFMGIEDWKSEALKKAILTQDGLKAFGRVLNSDLAQVIVSPGDLDSLLSESIAAAPSAASVPAARAAANATPSRGTERNEADQPTDEVETAVASIWSALFGIERIGIHEQFASLGGHSLLAMQLVGRLRASFGVEATLREFFEAPTIAELSSLIRSKLIAEIEGLTDDEVSERIANV